MRRILSWLVGVWLIVPMIAPVGARHTAHAQDDASWLLGQINGLRAGLGLAPYALNGQLSAAAAAHSDYMAGSCDISHTEANGSTPQSRALAYGYTGDRISENIYGGTNARATDAWTFWINSPVHYAGLTHDVVNEVGIGIGHGDCHAFTLLFGHRADVTAPAPVTVPEVPDGVPDGGSQSLQAPTQRPYVPPPPTNTPTPTIPTLTPSATWTITPTHTPQATVSAPSATATALVLPTVPAIGESAATAVAVVPSNTPLPASPVPSATPSNVPPSPAPVSTNRTASDSGIDPRDLIPFALVGQAIVIGVAGIVYFRRAR